MQASYREAPSSALADKINKLLGITLSPKLKFAIKTALAIALAYLIAFSQGWVQAQTAAITIMLIAVAGPVKESVSKGFKRVIGTVIGAVIGMTLIALFPQDRFLYLLLLSIFVTFALYLTRAYKGDNTVFMLMAVTMMMVFKNGEVDDVFLYGLDRTFMTIFGIALYTLIATLIWPVKIENNMMELAQELLSTQEAFYQAREKDEETKAKLYAQLREKEEKLSHAMINHQESELTMAQRSTLMDNASQINVLLLLLSYHKHTSDIEHYSRYIKNYEKLENEITTLFEVLKQALQNRSTLSFPDTWEPEYNREAIQELSNIDRAALTATISDMKKLHEKLCDFAQKLNAITSVYPTHFALSPKKNLSMFNWLDPEDLKGSLITFIVFWASTLFWIYFNPPAGFLIVTLATTLSVLTTFSPLIKPSLLIILFTFSFIFSTAMYILVLPHVHYSWELGLFIFVYAFIGLYFIPEAISIFFLFGLAVLGLSNPMYFNFNIFLVTLFVFYLFLFILLLFYYIPFSTKAEKLFLTLKQRFFLLSENLLDSLYNFEMHRHTFLDHLKMKYSQAHLMNTVKKMQLWANQIDETYFNDIDKKKILAFSQACESFAYLLTLMVQREKEIIANPLIKSFREHYKGLRLKDVFHAYASGGHINAIDQHTESRETIIEKIEIELQYALEQQKNKTYTEEEIIIFYENLSLHQNVWIAWFKCLEIMNTLDFKKLKTSRF